MEAIKEKESVFIRVFRVFRDQKNKSELFGTMRNDAEPCGHFRFPRVVSLHCLSDTENMDYGNPSLDYGPAGVDYGSP